MATDDYSTRLNDVLLDEKRLALFNESGLLDLEVSIALDRLTRIARRLVDAPVALISMVGSDFQFFKSSQGLGDLLPEGRRTPLSHSFCQHVVASGQPFIVPDAREHPLVKNNLAIDELNVEAYVGIPLELPDGFVMGSLCAIDTKPRCWSDDDVAILGDLANSVMLEIGLQREVTRRIAIEQKLRESEARFNQVAGNIEGLVFQRRKDEDGSYSYCFFGDSAELALPWRRVGDDNPMPHRFGRVHPNDWRRLSGEIAACIQDEVDLRLEYRTINADGRIRHVRSQSKVRRSDDGTCVWDGAIFDVTDLVIAREQAEAAIASQRRMLSNINHDLRNPLTAIIGYGEVLIDVPPPAQVKKHADSIKRTGYLMLELVDQLLNAESMQSGVVALEAKRVSIGPIVADSCQVLERTARLMGIGLTIAIDPDMPEVVSCDPVRLQEVLVNLIGNAVKYTEKGSVAVHASRSKSDGVRFEIRDTGIGIPAGDIDRIFERQHRVEGHRATYVGTGLGLSIVKELVEAMSGTLGVESVDGQGSLFWFELPASVLEEKKTGSIVGRGKSILVADDMRANRTLIRDILVQNGYEVLCVSNGEEAVNAAKTLAFDLIMLDFKMPIMNGAAAAKAIRVLPLPARNTPIVGISADEDTGNDDALAGMNALLGKPFKIEALLQTVEHWCGEGFRELKPASEP